ncbi:MAG: YIP1 family protein [Ruminococcus sp.]|nr:YIP1 family protein [Ruminococcus sp.]
MIELTEKQWVLHTVFHPFDGFEDLRFKKAGSILISNIVIALWFAGTILRENFYGKQFVITSVEDFSILSFIIRTVFLFLAWTVSNRAVCTFFDGEGTIRRIYIYSAYALIPYTVSLYVQVMLSHILIRDEGIFITLTGVIGILWSAMLIFTGIKAAHQLSVSKTVLSILFTIAGMIIIILILVLAAALIQQIYVFAATIIAEIEYRLKY